MPSLGDSAVIIFLGLLLFGPKGLAQIARQLGKLMGEFRRASNEFRMQMEEELRVSEQAERQKQIAAIEAAAPPAPPVLGTPFEEPLEEHPHMRSAPIESSEPAAPAEPLPIATSGDLSIMPPATGLPAPRTSSLGPLVQAIPHVEPASLPGETNVMEAADQRPMRYTNGHADNGAAPPDRATADESAREHVAEEPVHG